MSQSVSRETPVYLTEDVRRIEQAAAAFPEPPDLMARAGLAAAEIARDLLGDSGKRALILAGPGNNGGDAFVVARYLKQWFFGVTVVFIGDAAKLPADAAAAARAWRDAGGATVAEIPAHGAWGLIVDGLFGIGLQREIAGPYARLVEAINRAAAPKLALDIPSGLESDTGRVLGCAVRADHTATFIALKPGLLTRDGPDYCGRLHVCGLGLDAPAMVTPTGVLIGPGTLASVLPPRQRNTHKGTYGSVGIVGGAPGMVGAALLAGRAALKLGAGRVYVGLLARDAPRLDFLCPELMLRSAEDALQLEGPACLAVGPGLGQSPDAAACLASALKADAPLVIDADGLNLIAREKEHKTALRRRDAPTILTPHPAEAARLLGCSTAAVQENRVAAAQTLARDLRCAVVLKGAGSVCAGPDGAWGINASGNPGMATGGMGDALTGIIAALVAQGAEAQSALRAAVHLHGAAADRLADEEIGTVGLTASETIDAARRLFNRARARS